jgi:hypothetical protein
LAVPEKQAAASMRSTIWASPAAFGDHPAFTEQQANRCYRFANQLAGTARGLKGRSGLSLEPRLRTRGRACGTADPIRRVHRSTGPVRCRAAAGLPSRDWSQGYSHPGCIGTVADDFSVQKTASAFDCKPDLATRPQPHTPRRRCGLVPNPPRQLRQPRDVPSRRRDREQNYRSGHDGRLEAPKCCGGRKRRLSVSAILAGLHPGGPVPIPAEVARRTGMMPPTDSEMISPTVPR